MVNPHIESYKEIPLLEGLSKEEVNEIIGLAKPCWFEKGEVIFREGDNSNSMYLMEEGAVVVKKRLGKTEEIIAHIRAKSIFGEMALTTDDPRVATIIATTRVHAGEIRYEDFKKLVASQSTAASKVALNIARVLTARINHLLNQLNKLSLSNQNDEDATELAAFRQQVFSEWSF